MTPHVREDRRYQVFVSSTYSDLIAERQEVIATLLELDAFPAGMELFPAADDDAWTIIKRVIDESDYYLLIIGGRYGSVSEEEVGYTEMEYEYATKINKPVMAFLHKNPDSIPAGKSEQTDHGRERLAAFRAKVGSAKHVKFWESKEELAGHVARTFSKFVRDYPAVGWTRASAETAEELELALTKARLRIAELESLAAEPPDHAPEGSEGLAQGSDELRFVYGCRFTWWDESLKYNNRRAAREWISDTFTWDEAFAAIATRMLDEADEAALNATLASWILNEHWEALHDALDDRAKKVDNPARLSTARDIEIEIGDDDFGVILLQLVALGLIGKSEKKRSVKDSGTYWSLTPYGLSYATRLRARRKGSDPLISTINANEVDAESKEN